MDNIQALFYNASDCLGSGNLKSSYELYLKALDATLYELHQIKFVDQYALLSDDKDELFIMAKTCLENTQTILNTTKRRRPTPPPIPPKPLSISKRKFKIDTTTTRLAQPSQVRPTTVWKKIAQKPATVIVPNRPKKSNTTTTTIATTVNTPEVRTSLSDNYPYYNHDEDANKRGEDLKARSQLLRQPSNVPSSNNIPPSSPLVNPINVVKTFLSSSLQDKQSGYSSFSSTTNAAAATTTTATTATTTTNSREDEFIIMASGTVDPARLTQAQTLIDTTISYTNIPFIPQAPLHIIYKSLQQKLENQERHHLHSAEVKQALTRVRQIIHMTSITSPTTTTTSNNSNYQYPTTTTSLLDFPPVLVAYQLTLIDSAIFRNIQPSALLNHHAPKSPHPAITASTDFFNYLTRIIEHVILSPSEASGRAEQINFWIKVAIKCHDLKNFQTLKAIISALGTPPIQRLKRSWAFVPKKSLARLDVVNEIMTEHNNYERYRDRISRIVQQTFREPMVPFLGVFMHDVTYLTSIPMASTSSSSAPPFTTATTPNESCNNNNNNSNKHVTKLDDLLALFTNLHKHPPYSSALPPFCVKDFNKRHQQRKPFANESLELQQCIVTQYLLTRSFVAEKTVDELSLFREPPKVMRSCSATDPTTLIYDGGLWSSSGSLLSFVGTNSTASSSNSRPVSLESDDDDNNDSDISNNNNNNNMSKFWVFGRKSVDHQHPLKKTSLIDITNNNNNDSVIPTLPNIPPKHLRRDRLSRHFSFEDLDARKKHQQQQHQEQQQGLSIFRKEFSFWRKEQDGGTSVGTTPTAIAAEPPTSTTDSQHPLDFNPIYKRNSATLLERTITS